MTLKSLAAKLAVLLPLLMLILAWHIATHNDDNAKFILSTPQETVHTFLTLLFNGELLYHAWITSVEATLGFLLGTVTGTLIGLALWYSPLASKIAKPYLIALGAIPIFALAPVLIVWFGVGLFSKVIMAALPTFIIAINQAYQGSQSCDPQHLRLLTTLGASKGQTFRFVVVPTSLTWVLNSMKLNIGLALMGAFIGEFISAQAGLGYLILKAAGLYNMAIVFSACIMLTIIAMILTKMVSAVETRLFQWH